MMSDARLFFHDSLAQKKREFVPLQAGCVKMYCCGITPYSNTHIGHTRTFFSYDLLYRTLKDAGFAVDWARNITDVDDKIINKAREEGVSVQELVSRYVDEQSSVLLQFNLNRPKEPRVTESIPQILEMIQSLVEKGVAYQSDSGVYFRVKMFPDYGKLSKNKVEELRRGARIEVDESKEDPVDFALWKLSKPGEPEEVTWESPWGKGRPGWHIECSAMNLKEFGARIDIHMGGRDLIFPHHECEIAQSEAATGQTFSNYWLHCGMVTLYGEKMSKSTNHFVSIADFLKKYPPEVLRLVFLSVSYSQPLDYTDELAQENFKKLGKLYRTSSLIDHYIQSDDGKGKEESPETWFDDVHELLPRMRSQLQDDLNSASALASFFEFARRANQAFATVQKKNLCLSSADREALQEHWPAVRSWMGESLGLFTQTSDEFFAECTKRAVQGALNEEQIGKLVEQRSAARADKNWQRADQIRDELQSHGIQVQDTAEGPKWTVEI